MAVCSVLLHLAHKVCGATYPCLYFKLKLKLNMKGDDTCTQYTELSKREQTIFTVVPLMRPYVLAQVCQ